MQMTSFPLIAALCLLAVALPSVAADWSQAEVGEWRLVWSVSDAEGYRNDFPELGLEVDFPIRWRHLDDSGGNRLALFDHLGRPTQEIPLGPGERALASEDGSVHVRWTTDPDDRATRHVSYWRADADSADWEASTRGEPILLASDGGVLVISPSPPAGGTLGVFHPVDEGRLLVIGSAGEVREELPFAPLRSAFGQDSRRLLFLRPGELVALERDGSLAWSIELPIDAVPAREGPIPLSCGGDLVAVCGTGKTRAGQPGRLRPERRGHLIVYDGDGRRQWIRRQETGEETWFAASAILSPTGEHLAKVKLGPRGATFALHDGADGELLWEHVEPHRLGFRTLSLTRGARRVALSHGDVRTHISIRDRQGDLVFQALLPLGAKTVRVMEGDLLIADEWVVLFRPMDDES